MELIDRKTTLDLGMKQYFTGKECLKGHIAPRRVSCGSCIECRRLRTKRWREEGKQSDFAPTGKPLPSQDYLRECFDYVLSTGQLIWRSRPSEHFKDLRAYKAFNSRFSGQVAGHYHSRNGYLEIRFNRMLYKGHRIIWKLLTGEDPNNMLDHINGDVSDNRIENLRVANAQENARNAWKRPQSKNASSEYKGVSKNKNGKWICYVTVDDTPCATTFDTELEAALHYDKTVKELFGEFARLNFPEGFQNE